MKTLRPYKPSIDELRELYEVQKMSQARIGHKYGRTAQTAHRWLRDAGIVEDNPSDAQDKLAKQWVYEQARLKREARAAKAQAAQSKENDEENTAIEQVQTQETLVPVLAPIPAISPQSAPLTDATAMERLSDKQRIAVQLIGSMLDEERGMTYLDIAERMKIAPETLFRWRRDALFQEALKEYSVPQFASLALELTQKRLLDLIKSGKDRPEDRKLLAEITGLVNGDSVNVNVGIIQGPSHLMKRWQ